MKLPLDPRLPIIQSDTIRPLTQRLYELFRLLFQTVNQLEETVSGLSGGGGGSASINTGIVTVDFGTGSNIATVTVTGQTSITATSSVWLERVADSSGSHTASDAAYAALFVALTASTPTAGSGFTIYATCADKMTGTYKVRWSWS